MDQQYPTTHTNADVHKARTLVDELVSFVETFSPSRELSLAKTKLQEAKHWLGDEFNNVVEQVVPQTAPVEQQPVAAPEARSVETATPQVEQAAPQALVEVPPQPPVEVPPAPATAFVPGVPGVPPSEV